MRNLELLHLHGSRCSLGLSVSILTIAGVLFGCALLLIGVCEISEAQQRKTPIYLECPGKDEVGLWLCFQVRELLRKSAAFSLALDRTDAFVRVRIHSVDKDTSPTGNGSSVSVILTFAKSDGYLHDQILFVGINAVEKAAAGIVAGIDQYLDQLFRDAARETRQPPGK